MKIHPVGAELFHADGWTDMMKLSVTFRNFANAPSTPHRQKQVFRENNKNLSQDNYMTRLTCLEDNVYIGNMGVSTLCTYQRSTELSVCVVIT